MAEAASASFIDKVVLFIILFLIIGKYLFETTEFEKHNTTSCQCDQIYLAGIYAAREGHLVAEFYVSSRLLKLIENKEIQNFQAEEKKYELSTWDWFVSWINPK